nr:hypothetical protein NCPCFENI_01356 [Cupriavidus sp.]
MAQPLVAVIAQNNQPIERAVLTLFENPLAGLLGPVQFVGGKGKTAELADNAVRRLCVRVFHARNLRPSGPRGADRHGQQTRD